MAYSLAGRAFQAIIISVIYFGFDWKTRSGKLKQAPGYLIIDNYYK
jgi:hypothetical protein